MTTQVYQLGGFGQAQAFPLPIQSPRSPVNGSDVTQPDGSPYVVGQGWQNTTTGIVYQFIGSAAWMEIAGATGGPINTLTGDSGGAIGPTAGNITLNGTASQIVTTGAGSAIVWSLPAAITAPGSLTTVTSLAAGTTVTAGTGITATTGNIVATAGNISTTAGSISSHTTLTAGTGITATSGAITATNGNLVLGTAGNKILSTSVASNTATAGANSFGTVTLIGGTITVATTAVTANSIILLTRMSVGATGAAALGILSVGTITAATSFVINAWLTANATSLATTDVSVIGWQIIN